MRSGADDQGRILETSLVQNGGLLKHRAGRLGRKSGCPGVVRGGRLCILELGGGKEMGVFNRTFIH